MRKILIVFLAVVALIIAGFSSAVLNLTAPSGNVEKFFKNISISFDGQPLLNQPVRLTSIAELPPVDIPNATIEFILPEGIEFISGNLKWQGDLKKNDTIILKAEVKATKPGNYAIQFLSIYMKDSLPLALDTKFIYVSVFESEAKVSDTPLPWIKYNIAKYPDSLKTDTESG